MQKSEIGLLFYTIQKINSKWIKKLNLRSENITLLEGNNEKTLLNIGLVIDILDRTSKPKTTTKSTNGTTSNKSFCTVKETINEMKRQPTGWEENSVNHVSEQGLISKT